MGGNADPRYGAPDQTIIGMGEKGDRHRDPVLGQHTLPEGLALYTTALCALWNIHSLHSRVGCTRYVARVTPREGAGLLPAPLLDLGQLPGQLPATMQEND